ncbi:MAG: hypothetical protein IT158_02810 [Bryobacterales bacterium]|nr:hypothetical protein [Bryobacterales bacterium]
MQRPRIGFVTCVHPIYDLPAVVRHRDAALAGLEAAGCDVIRAEVPRTSLDALEIAALLKRNNVDLALLFFCTWVAEDITLALARELGDLPLLLWALPYLDRDIPMPSPMSGVTATAANLHRMGKAYAHMIGPVTEEKVGEAAGAARAAAVLRALRRARFGLVGRPCPGMMDVSADETEIQRLLGPATVQLELSALLGAAESASENEAAQLARELSARVGAVNGPGQEQLVRSLKMYLGMKELVDRHRLDGYCVRCWPELRDQHKTTVCLTHACMAEAGVPSTCEIDLPALITAFLMNRLAGAPVYSFDVTGYLEEEDAVQLAHCGSAALSLAADPRQAQLRTHMRTATGVTLEFGFRPGPVTLAKLMRPENGGLRLFVRRGEALPTSGVRGSVATVRPAPSASTFLDEMMGQGVEHHLVLAYGDLTRELGRLCRFAGIESC